ncbi:MAG TPA: hypothetical protein IAB02_04835 [Candidatus Pullichristensenella excrementigallinarum]|uniref:Uncharacterized protein n=1 Tax=Candidatus Pullichristensenella excrementigallinarum TaxID=2840907 RepID=A0A9D1LCN6_9FIRM|nr:hypothetical protein [Candidatus Pullichristensenella excrementigallinarum]
MAGVIEMLCGFCERELEGDFAGWFALCPQCEQRLILVNPHRPEYPWFVGAMRRALFGENSCEESAFPLGEGANEKMEPRLFFLGESAEPKPV